MTLLCFCVTNGLLLTNNGSLLSNKGPLLSNNVLFSSVFDTKIWIFRKVFSWPLGDKYKYLWCLALASSEADESGGKPAFRTVSDKLVFLAKPTNYDRPAI